MAVGWKITRQNPIFPPHSTPSALQASLKPKDQPRSLVGIVLVLKGCAFPYRSRLRIPVPLAAGALATRRNGWDKTADMRSISWLFHASGFASELEAEGAKKSHIPKECSRFFVAERSGFEPEIRFCRIHAFQACLLSHSSISPEWECKYTESFCIFATLKNCFDFFAGFSLENRRIFHRNIAGFPRDFRETDGNARRLNIKRKDTLTINKT